MRHLVSKVATNASGAIWWPNSDARIEKLFSFGCLPSIKSGKSKAIHHFVGMLIKVVSVGTQTAIFENIKMGTFGKNAQIPQKSKCETEYSKICDLCWRGGGKGQCPPHNSPLLPVFDCFFCFLSCPPVCDCARTKSLGKRLCFKHLQQASHSYTYRVIESKAIH